MRSQVSGVVSAEYELEYLLLEGHCFDLSTSQPPRGLQFTLGMKQDPLMHDTIVMANLVRLSINKDSLGWIGLFVASVQTANQENLVVQTFVFQL